VDEKMRMGLYLHSPFCQAKCSYCDFNSYAGLEHLYAPYLDAMIQEVRWLARRFAPSVATLFLGGGTPTVLPIELLRRLLAACFEAFAVEDGAEITSEANPGTLSPDYLQALRRLGINRLSLGAQSFDRAELAMLGRIHTAEQVALTAGRARAAGFDNLNLDLIYGLPGQSLAVWRHTVECALALAPEHLSLYCLTVEEGTPLHEQVWGGRLPSPDPDLAADMYDLADGLLVGAGYRQYEISNWSLPGYECAHNLIYWRNQPYLGVGAGAHSSATGRRWWNVLPVQAYVDRLARETPTPWPSPAAEGGEIIDRPLEMGETLMLGLRLTREGVSEADFRRRFGASLEEVYGQVIGDLVGAGLLVRDAVGLRLSGRGRLLGNQVFAQFLPG
jgi:oxygen-independent coproporphyrinogen-3 oxidase